MIIFCMTAIALLFSLRIIAISTFGLIICFESEETRNIKHQDVNI